MTYHPTGSSSTHYLSSGQADPRVEAMASYILNKLQSEIPTTLVPRLKKAQICRTTSSKSLHITYLCLNVSIL